MNWARTLLVIVVASCSSPPKVTILPGQQAVVGNATFRTQANGTVVVVRRSLGETSATGQVLLRAVDLGPAQQSPHLRLAGARAWLAVARTLSAGAALDAARHGADELGADYAKQGTRDDTHTKQWLAEDEAKASREDHAAELMIAVLDSRIAMYTRRYDRDVE